MGAANPARGTAKPTVAAVLGLKDLPPSQHLQNTPGSPLAVELGGGLLQPSDRETRFGCLPSFNSHPDVLPGGYSRKLHFNSPAGLAGFCWSLRRGSSGSLRAGSSRSIPHPAAACQDRQRQAEMLQEESPPTGILGEGDHPVETRRRSHRDAGRRRNGACWWVPWGGKQWPHAGPGGRGLVGLGCAAGSSWSRAASWPHGLGI